MGNPISPPGYPPRISIAPRYQATLVALKGAGFGSIKNSVNKDPIPVFLVTESNYHYTYNGRREKLTDCNHQWFGATALRIKYEGGKDVRAREAPTKHFGYLC